MAAVSREDFDSDFLLGVATSSYQIEGAVREDGRLPSIWDEFSRTPLKVKNGDNGDVACDHYHRVQEDIELMAWLGVEAYRFSLAWPRVIPQGRGAVNELGLDFYERLVDKLLAKGIQPCATLYHWDLPAAIAGGWLNRDVVHAFAEFAEACAKRLGDRVSMWFTHNEPWCQAFLGYGNGLFAPGHTSLSEALLCAHHLLVSHGLAVQALRAHTKSPVGAALNFMPAHPATQSEADRQAAQRQDGHFNRWFVEPIAGRGYPEDMLAVYEGYLPTVHDGDMQLIAEPVDLLGVNYYERIVVRDAPDGAGPLYLQGVTSNEYPRTQDREIYAPGISETLHWLHKEFHFSQLVITENGAAFEEEPGPEGVVEDAGRVAFFEAHLAEVLRARRAGVPVSAYFAWSLMDNFEWSEGYTVRYGLTHVDFQTQKRTPKRSAHFLRSLRRVEK